MTDTASAALLVREAVEAFYEAVNAAAEAEILNGKPVTGAHHRALERLIAERRRQWAASLPAPAAPERTYTQRELVEACQVAFADAVSACRQGYVSMDVHAPIPAPAAPEEEKYHREVDVSLKNTAKEGSRDER